MAKWWWNRIYNVLISDEEIILYKKYNPYLLKNNQVTFLGEFETKEDAQIKLNNKLGIN